MDDRFAHRTLAGIKALLAQWRADVSQKLDETAAVIAAHANAEKSDAGEDSEAWLQELVSEAQAAGDHDLHREPLPCPFCGLPARYIQTADDRHTFECGKSTHLVVVTADTKTLR